MKVLLLVQKEQRAILDRLYDGIAQACSSCDVRWLSGDEQANLRRYFREQVDCSRYDRIVFFLRFKKEMKQWRFIRSVPNLVILEHDAYQNYIPCKYTGAFSRHYRRMPWVRIISSGAGVAQHLRDEGFDAHFVPKGYDQALLQHQQLERDIELAFVGSLKSVAYSGRKALLEELAQVEPLLITKTNSGQEYCDVLNRIRFFVSADVGMGEYMIKNFEAMACGCVLLAYDHGEVENSALGFVDMQNLVLYRTVAELREKLNALRQEPQKASAIAEAGRQLSVQRYGFDAIGRQIVEVMRPQLRQPEQPSWLQRHLRKLGIYY